MCIRDRNDIENAYKNIDKGIKRCGPSFFTKHFYFLGKSNSVNHYPVIFDNRVANGMVKISCSDSQCLDIVTVNAKTKAKSYLAYLKMVHEQADLVGCEPDQIEYYLFTR